jgi:ABC-type branched-subunit amino acid transport system substrate-binding protein
VDGPIDPEFVKKYEQRYGQAPTSYAGYAYDILMMLNGLRLAGHTTPEAIRTGHICPAERGA